MLTVLLISDALDLPPFQVYIILAGGSIALAITAAFIQSLFKR